MRFQMSADFSISDQGSLVMFSPQSEAAKAFVEEKVDVPGWAWLGNAFGVEHRMADGLIEGIEAEGLSVEAV